MLVPFSALLDYNSKFGMLGPYFLWKSCSSAQQVIIKKLCATSRNFEVSAGALKKDFVLWTMRNCIYWGQGETLKNRATKLNNFYTLIFFQSEEIKVVNPLFLMSYFLHQLCNFGLISLWQTAKQKWHWRDWNVWIYNIKGYFHENNFKKYCWLIFANYRWHWERLKLRIHK